MTHACMRPVQAPAPMPPALALLTPPALLLPPQERLKGLQEERKKLLESDPAGETARAGQMSRSGTGGRSGTAREEGTSDMVEKERQRLEVGGGVCVWCVCVWGGRAPACLVVWEMWRHDASGLLARRLCAALDASEASAALALHNLVPSPSPGRQRPTPLLNHLWQ
jgi:hypothetical protein